MLQFEKTQAKQAALMLATSRWLATLVIVGVLVGIGFRFLAPSWRGERATGIGDYEDRTTGLRETRRAEWPRAADH
jgi:hypothetical protein